MTLPFTPADFSDTLRRYNEMVWPAQWFLLALALLAVLRAVRGTPRMKRGAAATLSLLWLWMAGAYHFAFFSSLSRAGYLFGALFLLQGGLFAWLAWRPAGLAARPTWDTAGAAGWAMVLYALAVYPALSYLIGHRYPASPTFGLPCPTTIFTLGILTWAGRAAPWPALVVPMAWSVVGTSAALQLGMREDLGLPTAAVLTIALRMARRTTDEGLAIRAA
jgi:hypothetical protein